MEKIINSENPLCFINKDTTVRTQREIRYMKIGETDFAIYEDTWYTSVNGGKADVKVTTGISSIENINETPDLQPISTTVKAPRMYSGTAQPIIMRKELIDKVKAGCMHIHDAIVNAKKETINPFSLPQGAEIFLYNWGSERIARLDGRFVSIPVAFDYINGGIDNLTYNLHKLLEKLKKDIHVLHKNELKIESIPYYNCYGGKNKTIDFLYLASDDDYDRIAGAETTYDMCYCILSELMDVKDCRRNGDN